MKSKKLILIALTVALVLSAAVPAIMAANETVINGAYEEILIDVVVMPTAKATINPYGMPVPVYDTAATPAKIEGKTLKTAGQIATQPLVMYNKTDSKLSVGATVTASGVSGLELVSSIPANSDEKQAMVFLEAQQAQSLTGDDYVVVDDTHPLPAGYIGTVDGAKLVDEFNDWPASTYSASATNMILVDADDPVSKAGIAVMDEADSDGKPQTTSYVLYRLAGKCVEEPETAWRTSDKFTVKVAFSFKQTT